MEPCFAGRRWTPACRWEVMNKFIVLLCLHAWLLLCLLHCLYLSPRVFSLLHFWFSPSFHQGEWASSCVVFSCRLGLNNDICLTHGFWKWHCKDFGFSSSCTLNSCFHCSVIYTGLWHWTFDGIGRKQYFRYFWLSANSSLHSLRSVNFNVMCSGMRVRWSDFAEKTASLCTEGFHSE